MTSGFILFQVSQIMDQFERDFEHLDVQTQTMEDAMSGVTTLTTPEVRVTVCECGHVYLNVMYLCIVHLCMVMCVCSRCTVCVCVCVRVCECVCACDACVCECTCVCV